MSLSSRLRKRSRSIGRGIRDLKDSKVIGISIGELRAIKEELEEAADKLERKK